MGETVLITGASGYLGHELVREILERSEELGVSKLIALDDLRYGQDNLAVFARNPKFEFVNCDVRNYEELQKHVSRANVIYILAAVVGAPACSRNKRESEEINTNQVNFIVNNCSYGTKIIYPCTNSIFGASPDGVCNEESEKRILSLYADTKWRGEQHVLDYGGISTRLSTVMGFSGRHRRDLLVNSFVLEALQNGYIILAEEHFMRSYVHILDVISAFIHCYKNYDKMKGQAYNVSAEDCSKRELCEKIKKYIPKFVIKSDSISEDVDKRNYRINFDKIKKTGWSPKYSVEVAIRELISGYPILLNSTLNRYTNL